MASEGEVAFDPCIHRLCGCQRGGPRDKVEEAQRTYRQVCRSCRGGGRGGQEGFEATPGGQVSGLYPLLFSQPRPVLGAGCQEDPL